MKLTTTSPKVVAATGISTSFKPPAGKRQIRLATPEQVREAGKVINAEFKGALELLAK